MAKSAHEKLLDRINADIDRLLTMRTYVEEHGAVEEEPVAAAPKKRGRGKAKTKPGLPTAPDPQDEVTRF